MDLGGRVLRTVKFPQGGTGTPLEIQGAFGRGKIKIRNTLTQLSIATTGLKRRMAWTCPQSKVGEGG